METRYSSYPICIIAKREPLHLDWVPSSSFYLCLLVWKSISSVHFIFTYLFICFNISLIFVLPTLCAPYVCHIFFLSLLHLCPSLSVCKLCFIFYPHRQTKLTKKHSPSVSHSFILSSGLIFD
jgi:hypothetical protein